jgi:mannose-6-phosphate isomerase-like protein (cupin superfamily)
MDPYTKLNLRTEVEDQAPNFGFGSNLEFRMAGGALAGKQSAVSFLRIAPNYRLPFGHRHKQQEEVYVLVSGSARLKLDDDVLVLEPWDVVRIAKATVRNLEGGPDGAEVLLFGAPASGAGDAEMLQEWWTD